MDSSAKKASDCGVEKAIRGWRRERIMTAYSIDKLWIEAPRVMSYWRTARSPHEALQVSYSLTWHRPRTVSPRPSQRHSLHGATMLIPYYSIVRIEVKSHLTKTLFEVYHNSIHSAWVSYRQSHLTSPRILSHLKTRLLGLFLDDTNLSLHNITISVSHTLCQAIAPSFPPPWWRWRVWFYFSFIGLAWLRVA